MRNFVYPPEKKDALAGVPAERLRDFALGIPAPALQSLLDHLPSVRGFRPGKDGPVRLLTYFGRLNRWTEDDWSLLGRIWGSWTLSQPAFAETLNLSTLEELRQLAEDIGEDPSRRRNTVMVLVQAAQRRLLTQETIRRWYDFGPMPPDTEVTVLCGLAPTQDEIALSDRLAALEKKVSHADEVHQNATNQIKSLVGEVGSVKKVFGVVAEVQSKLHSFDQHIRQTSEKLRALEHFIGQVDKDVETQRGDLKKARTESNAMLQQIADLGKEAEEARKGIARMTAVGVSHEQAIAALTNAVEVVQGKVDEIHHQIESQQNAFLRAAGDVVAPSQTCEGKAGLVVRETRAMDAVSLDTLEEAEKHLSQNLHRLGIKLPQAQRLATDIVASLCGGQVITFGGALSSMVAERCAASLAGGMTRVVHIPVGLLDSKSVDSLLASWVREIHEDYRVVGVVLEGANRSAIEVYSTGIRQFAMERILGMNDAGCGLFVFASLVDGPSAIPPGKSSYELGPFFDVDALGWIDKLSLPVTHGHLKYDALLNAIRNAPTIGIEWEETDVPGWLLREGGVLWRRTLLQAVRFRSALSPANFSSTESISPELAFGWILPMALQTSPAKAGEVSVTHKDDARISQLLLLRNVEVTDYE